MRDIILAAGRWLPLGNVVEHLEIHDDACYSLTHDWLDF